LRIAEKIRAKHVVATAQGHGTCGLLGGM